MPTVDEAFVLAVNYHRAGRTADAEQLYRQILEADPNHADTLHLLGVLAYQAGQYEQSIGLICQALTLHPGDGIYDYNLGLAQKALGRREQAVASFQKAIQQRPEFPDAFCALGNALALSGNFDEAETQCRQALLLNPDHAEAHNNLANALLSQGRAGEAIEQFQAALRLRPNFAEARSNLASALVSQGRLDEALPQCVMALRLAPSLWSAHKCLGVLLARQEKYAEAIGSFHAALHYGANDGETFYNLGLALNRQEDPAAAIEQFQLALQRKPNCPEALNDMGIAQAKLWKFDEAVASFHDALRLKPRFAEAHYNLGDTLVKQGKDEEACIAFGEALECDPDAPATRWKRALSWLRLGNFAEGWPEYESRWMQPSYVARHQDTPLWDGSRLNGRTILIHAEQGLGDSLQFIRFLPLLRERGGKVIFECLPPLVKILEKSAGIDCLVSRGSSLPPFDVQAPLLSVPGILRATLETIPSSVPYLHANSDLVAKWRQELRKHSEPKEFLVGIAWQGNPAYFGDDLRSIPLARFAPLAALKGVRLINLQKKGSGVRGQGSDERQAGDNDELHTAPFELVDFGDRLDADAGAFMDTAAIMMSLDLVITSDTAIAHLAGALAVPVWVALTFAADWRWLLQRDDSPWYPTMRLFRQRCFGDWEEVFERIATELERIALG